MTTFADTVTIANAAPRTVVRLCGRISHIEVSPSQGPSQVVARIDDGTGVVDAVFMGRRLIPGIEPGQHISIEGRVVPDAEAPRIYNPRYELTCQP
jgi:RecJ-like exonuclease